MPTSTDVTKLKINELTEAQFDSAVQGGVIGANELSILTDVEDTVQVETMPTASASVEGKIYQFIGTTDANYTHGYFYECVSDGQNPATYSWTQTDVQPSATKHKYTVTLEMIQGQTMTAAFYMRGAAGKTTNLNITQFMSYEEGGVWGDPYFDGQYIGFLKSGADGISASKIVALNTETNNLGFDVYATDDNNEPIIEFVADYAPSYVTEDSVKVIFEIESDEPLVEVITSEAGEYLGDICITQAVPYLSLAAPSGADQDYVLQNRNGERISWVAAPTGLPSQTGNSGKFLTTDGTDASWATVDAIQVSTMPTAGAGEVGKVYQFIGTTDANYTHGYFYECVSDGATPTPNYSWSAVSVQAGGGGGGQNIQVSTLPTASATEEDKIYQFVGANGSYDGKYLYNGYFYKCVSDGAATPTYSWNAIPVMSVSYLRISTSTNYVLVGDTLTYAGKIGTVAIGNGAGYNLNLASATNYYGVMIGCSAIGGPYSTTVGYDAKDYGNGIAIGYQAKNTYSPASYSINIGSGTINAQYVVAIGAVSNNTTTGSVAVGRQTKAGNYAVAVGYNAEATGSSSIAIRGKATASNAIQLGNGTNSEANTLYVDFYYNSAHQNYKLLDADGTIPADRFTTTPVADGTYVPTLTISSGVATRSWAAPAGGASSATGTLAAASWSSSSQTINVTGVTASNNVIVAAAPASQAAYTAAGVICTAQGAGTLTFTCTSTPSTDLTVNVLII